MNKEQIKEAKMIGSKVGNERWIAAASAARSLALPIIRRLHRAGKSYRLIAAALNAVPVPTVKNTRWDAPQVMRIIKRDIESNNPE